MPTRYEPVLGQPCPCGRGGEHEPVLSVSLPLSVTALSRVATALDKMLAESGRHGVFLADGKHPATVVYAVPR
jgi:hypothetical protein